MSTPAVVRVSAGVPTGGQFAPSALAESTVVLDGQGPTEPKLQRWGDALDAQIDAAVCDYAAWHDEQDHTDDERDITELLEVDEAELVAAYGQERADYLQSLRFQSSNDAAVRRRTGADDAECAPSGTMYVTRTNADGTDTLLVASYFSGGDEPDVCGHILSSCPEPLSDAAAAMPKWQELDSRLTDALETWATKLEEGDEETDFAELIGEDDEDAMIEAYGQGRSDFLCSLKFEAEVEERPIYTGRNSPSEYGMSGRLRVMSGDHEIARASFTHEDGPDISGLLDRCVTAPDGTTTVRVERRNVYGTVKEFHNASTGELTDGPDGAAAMSVVDSKGRILEEVHMLNGVEHGTSRRTMPDGSTERAGYVHGVLTDGVNLEPARKISRPDGSVTIEHHPKGVWAHTIENDASGNRTSQLVADPATGGTVRTNFEADGRTHATRYDANGKEQDGPNGEPAVEFRRPGSSVSSQTWYTNGTWTRTRDFNREGQMVVEFNNKEL